MKYSRWLIFPLGALLLLFARAVFAAEVLVDTTATRITAGKTNRKSVLLQNKGANSLWCGNKASEATSALGVEVVATGYMSFDATSSQGVWCSTSVLQSAGSGTRVMEL
jgi:hypothetical protein